MGGGRESGQGRRGPDEGSGEGGGGRPWPSHSGAPGRRARLGDLDRGGCRGGLSRRGWEGSMNRFQRVGSRETGWEVGRWGLAGSGSPKGQAREMATERDRGEAGGRAHRAQGQQGGAGSSRPVEAGPVVASVIPRKEGTRSALQSQKKEKKKNLI